MPSVLDLETLHKLHRATNQDKVYVAAVVQQDNGSYFFTVRFGRRGKTLQPRAWAMTSLGQARKAMENKVNEQLSEGYKRVDWGNPMYGLSDAVKGLGVLASARPANPPIRTRPDPIPVPVTIVDSDPIEGDISVAAHRFIASPLGQFCDVCGGVPEAGWHQAAVIPKPKAQPTQPPPEPKPVPPVAPLIPERGRRQPRAVHFDF